MEPEESFGTLGEALDAIGSGVRVDSTHLRKLATKSLGKFESELVFENEDGSKSAKDIPCEKNPGHPTFIPVSEFRPEHIPSQHRSKEFYDTIRARANLVAKIVVKRVSRNRPEFYSDIKAPFPYSPLKGSTRMLRYGTGYVVSCFDLQPYKGQFCPCHLCREHGERREFWSLNIATVTHVIYDSSEARDSVFQFFYDSEDQQSADFLYGTDSFEQVGKDTEKICIVRCVTHDKNLVRRLIHLITTCSSKTISKDEMEFLNDPVVLISHPHGKCKKITIGHVRAFVVPTGKEFPVNRPILFTRTSEGRLPQSNEDLAPKSEASSSLSSSSSEQNCPPLPCPLYKKTDKETYFEANGVFVVSTGKENILSPAIFRQEGIDASAPQQEKSGNEASNSIEDDYEDLANLLEYFYEASNYCCITVDSSSVFTTTAIDFGNPPPPRGMSLKGLVKQPNAPDPKVYSHVDRDAALFMFDRVSCNDQDSSLSSNQQQVIPDTASMESCVLETQQERYSEIGKSDCTSTSVSADVLKSNKIKHEPIELVDADNTLRCLSVVEKEDEREGKIYRNLTTYDISSTLSLGVSGNNDDPQKSDQCLAMPDIDSRQSHATLKSNGESEINKSPSQSMENASCSSMPTINRTDDNGATKSDSDTNSDLSLPEMFKIIMDKGYNLFPDMNTEDMSEVDMIQQLMSTLYSGDSLPLVSTLSKIYEEVATQPKNLKPLTFEPGSEFNIPEGMTFTLPEDAEYALCFHDLNSSWFKFPPGTQFTSPDGEVVDFPPHVEFSFRCQSNLQGHLTYKLDSCPGSSGGLVVLGRGRWHAGIFAHSGSFDADSNRSSLRRWLIYRN